MSSASVDSRGWIRPRGSWPLLATYRVEYELDGRRMVAFMATLSLSGMVLRSATGLQPGARLTFSLVLDGRGDALEIAGDVLPPEPGVPAGGAMVAFVLDDADGRAQLWRYFTEVVVPRLEKVTASPRPHVAKVLDLAGVYYDLGRDDDALALYRRALGVHKRELALFESTAALLLLRTTDTAADVASLQAVEELVRAGLALGTSDKLEALADACTRLWAELPPEAREPPPPRTPEAPASTTGRPETHPATVLPAGGLDALEAEARASGDPTSEPWPDDDPLALVGTPGDESNGAADATAAAFGDAGPFQDGTPASTAGFYALAPGGAGGGAFDERAELDELRAATETRGDELEARARDLDEHARALDTREAELTDRESAVVDAERRLAAGAAEVELREAELARRERMLAEQHLTLPSIEALQRETSELRGVNDTLAHELAQARERLTASGPLDSDALAELQARLQSSELARVELEHALAAARAAAEEAAERARHAEGNPQGIGADELAAERAAIAEERARLEAVRHEVLELDAARASLAHERGELEGRRAELQRFARDLEQTRDLLGQSFASQRARADELEQRAAALRGERDELQALRAAVESERAAVSALGAQLLSEERARREREQQPPGAHDEPPPQRQPDLEARAAALAEREHHLEAGRRALEETRAAVSAREQQLREERTLVPNLQAALETERAQNALLRRRAGDDAETLRRLESERARSEESAKPPRPPSKTAAGWRDRGRTYNLLHPSADVPHDSAAALVAAHRRAAARRGRPRHQRLVRRPGIVLAGVGVLALLALALAFLFTDAETAAVAADQAPVAADQAPAAADQAPAVESAPAAGTLPAARPRGRAAKRRR